MKIQFLVLFVVVCVLSGCRSEAVHESKSEVKGVHRIGIYDSRALAVAYCNTPMHKRKIQQLVEAVEEAKAKNDPVSIREKEAALRAEQDRLHRQGFSTAPVDDILALLQERIPAILQKNRIEQVISKWDRKSLEPFAQADTVDVTDELVQELHPNEKQWQAAMEIQKHDPVPLDQIDELVKNE